MNEITDLFTQNGADAYYGEPVTQLAHALQCAQLAEEAGADAETIAAAFLHDIGHMLPVPDGTAYMDDYGTVDHEGLGADFLRQQGFPEKVAQLVEHHVNAKRYLVFKNAEYRARLSEASQQTLLFQGGPMTADEAATFEQHPYFKPIIQLRLWDERAKLIDHVTPDAAHYLAIAAQVRSVQ
ncbi:metal dependent phosphohydrolase [Fibrella aestuarina BUZ 2]|uniref:Metal dependent phosphohydrolase n=1 Tax=Fibrella aestuarina BUZ 2 TaxID=1166018 RepID=I0KH28_9BACT|nr:HD domain-containing protein [Fibrella aestuarina]CCH03431.1 metal dependent phosphohydrolase [Fibrella aestuarina BUZ 2]